MQDQELDDLNKRFWHAVNDLDLDALRSVLSSSHIEALRQGKDNVIPHLLAQSSWNTHINENSWLDVVKLLHENGFPSDPDCKDDSEPCLIKLSKANRVKTVEWMLDHNYNSDATNEHGGTAIEVVYELGNDAMYGLLKSRTKQVVTSDLSKLLRAVRASELGGMVDAIEKGASPWEPGSMGESAYDVARNQLIAHLWKNDNSEVQTAEMMDALVCGDNFPSEEIETEIGAIGALTGHRGLMLTAQTAVRDAESPANVFFRICQAVFQILFERNYYRHNYQLVSFPRVRDFAYNLLDLCTSPTEDLLALAYRLVLYAELGDGDRDRPSSLAQLLSSFPAEGRTSEEPRGRPSEESPEQVDPLTFVEHRGVIQQFFETKAGAPSMHHMEVPVYVATARSKSGKGIRAIQGRIGTTPSVSYGEALVSVPGFVSPFGRLSKPSIFRLFDRKNVERFVQLQKYTDHPDPATVFAGMDNRWAQQGTPARSPEALVFVHGYHVTLEQAVERVAQLTAHMQFEGIPICFDWPSRGRLLGYMADEAQADTAAVLLAQFLVDLIRKFGPGNVHVIAHSMGNRVVLGAIRQLATTKRKRRPLGEVVLAAADVPDHWYRLAAPTTVERARRVSSYSSGRDMALWVSEKLHGDNRAGRTTPPIVFTVEKPGLFEAIDATAVHTGFLGHSFFGDNPIVVTDIADALNGRKPADRIRLRQTRNYWVIPK
jgi:esterase/lipase superfamily enzyme